MGTVTTRELTCIGCPMGCPLTVTMEAGEVISVTGNTCKRGDIYARKEVTNPTRIVTSTVRVTGGDADMVSVKTKEDIPKGKIFECVKALKTVEVPAPVHIGDVYCEGCGRYGCGYCCNEECWNKELVLKELVLESWHRDIAIESYMLKLSVRKMKWIQIYKGNEER